MEEKGIVARDCLRPDPASVAGSGAPAGDNRGQQSLSPPCHSSCTSGSQSQSSFPPIPSQPWLGVSLWNYQSSQRTRCVTCHNTNSRTVIQISKKCTTSELQCVYSHTHRHTHTHTQTRGARKVVGHCLIGGQILWASKAWT